jgi:hypothetical protein
MSDSDDNIFDNPLSNSAKSQLAATLDNSTRKLQQTQNSVEPSVLDIVKQQEDTTASVNSTINRLMSQLSPSGTNGSDASDVDIDRMLLLAHSQVKGDNKKAGLSKLTKQMKAEVDELKKQVIDANKQQIDNLMLRHKKKVADSVATYNMIIKIIPKMRLAINTLANTILSPDDFTKQSLSVSVDSTSIEASTINKVVKRAGGLLDKFNINRDIKNDIASYLINGKLIYLVLPLNREITRLLNENVSTAGIGAAYSKLDSTSFAAQTAKVLTESPNITDIPKHSELHEFRILFALKEEAAAITEAAQNVDAFFAREFMLGDAASLSMDSEENLNEAVSFGGFGVGTSGTSINNATSTTNTTDANTPNVKENEIKGRKSAIVKRVSPANIIPLTFENNNYGYLHLDIVEVDPDNHVLPTDSTSDVEGMNMMPSAAGAMSNGSILQNIISSSKDVTINGNNVNTSSSKRGVENPTGESDPIEDARLMFMANIFANKLSKQTNLKMLKRNEVLKDAIYNGLAIKKLNSNEKIRVVYLKPEEVVYINRGQSIFDNVLFFSKLYIATLTTILMQNVLNGGDRRIVYVEVGEDNNGAQAVQQVIRDMKSKEISSVMNMDLQSVLNLHAQFQDYYIPVVDGEKPISFDTMDSLANKSVDDEFLSWLSNNIFSGIGLPAAYLTEVENIDFAKSLSMQNSRFLRDCIAEQSILSRGFTELIRKIYALEYSENATAPKVKKGKKKVAKENEESESEDNSLNDVDAVGAEELLINLPAPAALALVNISEQLGNAANVIEAIAPYLPQLLSVGPDDLEKVTNLIKSKLARKLVTSLDWDGFDEIATQAIAEYTESQIENAIKTAGAVDTDTDINADGGLDDTIPDDEADTDA